MPVNIPVLKVSCDSCGNTDEVEFPYTYNSYSGDSGQYDYAAALEKLDEDGWDLEDGENHVGSCPECDTDEEAA